ncbi:hypothetical protein D8674_026851 [Pyrus ussuriensis x Pyrus communis]|uniref:Uncharacterized protein n=1 Tax=Pyrus ussuriensis x Pyrus communis TaxID=2448454 RepID=A0A5N5IAM8_9ROSA|nr:hypothetical protein D8674_026851 [Pyrus ussuriensis x Pyrus communis]
MRKIGIVKPHGAWGRHEEAVDQHERTGDPHPPRGMTLCERRGATWREVIGGSGKVTLEGNEGAKRREIMDED